MPELIPLINLRDSVWPLAVAQDIATDMTGVSLPIFNYPKNDSDHPYQVIFMLYYSVPGIKEPNKITQPYASLSLDLQSGELVDTKIIRSSETPKPLIGFGAALEVYGLVDRDRRNLQDLFFSRCDEAALLYTGESISSDQAAQLADLLSLYETLSEPPLIQDYETLGKEFFSWLRDQTKIVRNK